MRCSGVRLIGCSILVSCATATFEGPEIIPDSGNEAGASSAGRASVGTSGSGGAVSSSGGNAGTSAGVSNGSMAGIGGESAVGTAGAAGTAGSAAAGEGGATQAGAGGAGGSSGSAGIGGAAGGGGASAAGSGGVTSEPKCGDKPLTPKTSWKAKASHFSMGNGTESDNLYNPPARAIDSDPVKRWSTGKAQAGDEWIEIDFGALVTLNRVTLQGTASPQDYPRSCEARLSETPDVITGPVLAKANGALNQDTVLTFAKPATGRYLRISQKGSGTASWWSVHELVVTCNP